MAKLKQLTVIIGILSLTGLEALALAKGINGTAFATSMALIAGLSGFAIGNRRKHL
jgi:hypothetical protein